MKNRLFYSFCSIVLALIGLMVGACSTPHQFTRYEMEKFDITPITGQSQKTIKLINPSKTNVQHITAVMFDGGGNEGGHFKIERIDIGGEKVPAKDMTIPVAGYADVVVSYVPKDLISTTAEYGLWKTGPETAVSAMVTLGSGVTANKTAAVHRGIIVAQYDYPEQGNVYIEIVGQAVEGPHGEKTFSGDTATGECVPSDTMMCYQGNFSINLPGLMSGGALEIVMQGMIPFTTSGGALELDMNQFPDVLIPLRGNGPGEPLEGKPVSAISIIIDGAPDVVATGSYDGGGIHLENVGFRIRVVLGSVAYEDIATGLNAAVDFTVDHLSMTSPRPFDGNTILMEVLTTLSSNPSGNKLFDQFLGGADVIVQFDGTLLIK